MLATNITVLFHDVTEILSYRTYFAELHDQTQLRMLKPSNTKLSIHVMQPVNGNMFW